MTLRFTPYVEWYWNALQSEHSATYAYHAANYGSHHYLQKEGRS